MTDINQELDKMAENMEKSHESKEFTMDMLRKTVLTLGPTGLKKAITNLTVEQKTLLKGFLEDMKKSSKYSLEPVSDTTPAGDEKENEKKTWDKQDELMVAEAKKKDQASHRNQGGTPIEGWEGQVIKSKASEKDEAKDKLMKLEEKEHGTKDAKKLVAAEKKEQTEKSEEAAELGEGDGDRMAKGKECSHGMATAKCATCSPKKKSEEEIEKGGSGSGRHQINPALAGLESVKRMQERNAKDHQQHSQTDIHEKEMSKETPNTSSDSLKKEEPKMNLDEKKKAAKTNLHKMMKRMQERGMEKAICVSALAKSLQVEESKIAGIWDQMEKAYALIPPAEAAKQSKVPSQMAKEESGKAAAKKPLGETSPGKATETADKTISKVPETLSHKGDMKKAGEFWHDEGEAVYLAKSDANPFAKRTHGQNAAYKVDELIELQETSKNKRLAASTFDYLTEDQIQKGEAEEAMNAQVQDNAKKQAESKKDAKAEIRDIKVNEKLSRIESHGGPKMPFVKKMKKSFVDDLIEKSLDMDQGTLEAATANINRQNQGAFFVKSFADEEMDALFAEADMWKSAEKKSEKLKKDTPTPAPSGNSTATQGTTNINMDAASTISNYFKKGDKEKAKKEE